MDRNSEKFHKLCMKISVFITQSPFQSDWSSVHMQIDVSLCECVLNNFPISNCNDNNFHQKLTYTNKSNIWKFLAVAASFGNKRQYNCYLWVCPRSLITCLARFVGLTNFLNGNQCLLSRAQTKPNRTEHTHSYSVSIQSDLRLFQITWSKLDLFNTQFKLDKM